MNKLTFIIKGELPDCNQYVNACRSNKFAGGALKKEATEIVEWEVRKQLKRGFKALSEQVFIEFHWYCKNKKKDLDNISFAKKFVLDGLQNAGVITQDNWNTVIGFSDHFYLSKEDSRIEIIIIF